MRTLLVQAFKLNIIISTLLFKKYFSVFKINLMISFIYIPNIIIHIYFENVSLNFRKLETFNTKMVK